MGGGRSVLNEAVEREEHGLPRTDKPWHPAEEKRRGEEQGRGGRGTMGRLAGSPTAGRFSSGFVRGGADDGSFTAPVDGRFRTAG
jgi:hypothetical protein